MNAESLTISFLIGSSLFPPLLRVVPTSGGTKSCHPLRFAPPAFDSQQAPGPGERKFPPHFPTPSSLRRAGDGGGRAGAPGGSGGARLPGAQGAGALPLGRPPQQQAACPSRPRQPGLGAPLSPAVASAAPPDMRPVSAFWRRRLLPPGGVRCVRWFRSIRLLQQQHLACYTVLRAPSECLHSSAPRNGGALFSGRRRRTTLPGCCPSTF